MLNRDASLGNAEIDESDVERPMNAAHRMETGIEDDLYVVPDLLTNYTERRKRSFFPCSADEKSIKRLMSVILQYDYGVGGPDLFVGRDIALECLCCRYEISPTSYSETVKRETLLHTIHHENVPIHINDLPCDVCGQLNAYDGLDDGIFALDKNHIFTRESSLMPVCGTYVVLAEHPGTHFPHGRQRNGLQALHVIVLEQSPCVTGTARTTFSSLSWANYVFQMNRI